MMNVIKDAIVSVIPSSMCHFTLSMCCLVLHLVTVHSCVPTFTGSCRDLLLLMWSPWTRAPNRTGRESSRRSVLSACRYSWIKVFKVFKKESLKTLSVVFLDCLKLIIVATLDLDKEVLYSSVKCILDVVVLKDRWFESMTSCSS